MVMHSKGSFTTLSEQPAHIGWRNDKKVLTTLNRATGKMEQHQTTNRQPIYGTIQKVIKFCKKFLTFFNFFRLDHKENLPLENLILLL